jgi:glycopeptide antibiotics resistance protein
MRGSGATLLKTTLTIAVLLTIIYACGFLFVLIGSPVHQFTDVLDLIRSCFIGGWIAVIVVLVGQQNNAAAEQREERRAHAERERAAAEIALSIRRRDNPGAA